MIIGFTLNSPNIGKMNFNMNRIFIIIKQIEAQLL